MLFGDKSVLLGLKVFVRLGIYVFHENYSIGLFRWQEYV